jgi:endonuclease/exonuclease/phosphatase family metal-dependent hydrolase
MSVLNSTSAFSSFWAASAAVSFPVSRADRSASCDEGLVQYADWIRERPTVILGDFNDNASFKSGGWQALLDLSMPLGLVSAYHHHFAEEFGAESKPTHFHHGKQDAPFHLDYCFVPDGWAKRIRNVQVGSHEDWHKFSDHVPLTVDLDL